MREPEHLTTEYRTNRTFALSFVVPILTIVITVGSCQMYETHSVNTSVTRMVEAGADPLEARCAVESSNDPNTKHVLCAGIRVR